MRNRKGTESGLGAPSTADQVIAVTAGIFNTKAMNKTLARVEVSWLIALLNLSIFVVFHDKTKRTQQGNLPGLNS